jgi:hypothetical protein
MSFFASKISQSGKMTLWLVVAADTGKAGRFARISSLHCGLQLLGWSTSLMQPSPAV